MIGMMFLAVGLLWLALSWYLAKRVPVWLSIRHPISQWLMRAVAILVLLVGPFVDHIVGMRQFEKLCVAETSLNISSEAVKTKRAKGLFSKTESLEGYVIPVERDRRPIVDVDTGQEIAWYYRFRTGGGKFFGLLMLGGKHTCAIDQPKHVEHQKYLELERQTNFLR